MTNQQDARQAIRALLKAAATPSLSEDQARTLVNEALRNAEIAFGDGAGRELLAMAVDESIAIYEHGTEVLNKIGEANKVRERVHDFGPDRHSKADITCLICGLETTVPGILCGKTSMWGCPGPNYKDSDNSANAST